MKDYQTIYLDSDEDVASVIDRLLDAEDDNVVLVFPADSDIFNSLINLQLLKREAVSANKSIAIATSDKTGRQLSQRAGIPIIDEFEREGTSPLSIAQQAANKEMSVDDDRLIERNDVVDLKKPGARRAMMDIVVPAKKIVSLREKKQSHDSLSALKSADKKDLLVEEYRKQLRESADNLPARDEIKERVNSSPKTYEILERFQPVKREESRISKRTKVVSVGLIKKILTVFLGASVIVLGMVFYSVLPKAKVAIIAKSEQVVVNLSLVADKNITKADLSLNKIPAQMIKTEKRESKEFPVTGERYLEEKARGTITVYNAYSSSPQGLVQNTRFISTETGKLFRTTKTITIPGAKVEDGKIIASTIDIEVVADQSGPDYNIGPSNFTIPGFQGSPKYEGFYGKSSSAIGGGVVGKKKIVLAEDLENAKKALIDELKQKADQDIKDQLPSGFKLLDGSVSEGAPEILFSHQAGEPVDKFRAEARVFTSAVIFDEKHITELAEAKVVGSGSQDRQVISENRTIDYKNWETDFSKGITTMNVEVHQTVVWKIDPVSLKEKLTGKNEEEIRKVLSQTAGVQNAKVIFWPFWVKKIPTKSDRIEIVITK